MAEIVDELPERKGKSNKYPWKDWLNGKVWKLTQGTDFTCSSQTFRGMVYSASHRKGLKVITREEGNYVYLQCSGKKPKPRRGRKPKDEPRD